jgi:hypothetical protein
MKQLDAWRSEKRRARYSMSEQSPLLGTQQNPEQTTEFRPSRRPELGSVFGMAVVVVAACVVAVFAVIKLARFADDTDNRLVVVEMNQKVIQLQAKAAEMEKKAEAESQRVTSLIENHNRLIQALNSVFTAQESKLGTLDAKVSAAEFARTNVVVQMDKPEEPKKEKRR